MKPTALILHAAGTNRDADTAFAFELAGAIPSIVRVDALRNDRKRLDEANILVIPGGFSYADALGAGTLFALDVAWFFRDEIQRFVESGKPVIGICNGFQTLVKSGILPGFDGNSGPMGEERFATLAHNEKDVFECRWVTLKTNPGPCVWTAGIEELISCPIAHGEGRFYVNDESKLRRIVDGGLAALTYRAPDGSAAAGRYPHNPNGSMMDIAGICNPRGNVLGLMPHPEDNVISGDGARAYGGGLPGSGLAIFRNGVKYASQL